MTFEREKNRSHPLRLLIHPFVSRKVIRVALSHENGSARTRAHRETEKNKKSLSETHTRERRPRARASSERRKKKKKKEDERIEKRTHVSP